MRIFIVLVGVIIGVSASGLGWQALEHAKGVQKMAEMVRENIERSTGEIKSLQGFVQHSAISLSGAYALAVNDMRVLAQAHHLALAVHIDGRDPDIEKSAVPSNFKGLMQVRFKVIFTGLVRPLQLMALLDGVSSVEKADPVLVREILYKKDGVSVDLLVIGL